MLGDPFTKGTAMANFAAILPILPAKAEDENEFAIAQVPVTLLHGGE